ncbi:hypothetical protein AB0M80_18685 [Amycolatopsis sp. NPDC051045]|uniref:hypothetical protein n=1 Tax=Amycolatopsis sp. NPDC051045 TaxID=3156922 RepID=UPI00342027F8
MTNPVAGFPLVRADCSSRKRGQSALSRLPHTDAFTNHRVLSVADRMLILFLLVVLADEHGRLATLHRRLAVAAARDPEHWAAGRPADKLPNSTAKWLGKAAVRRPPWARIEEFLQLQVPPQYLPVVRAAAAGLFCKADGKERPDPDFRGPVHLPSWARHTRATTEAIIADVTAMPAPLAAEEEPETVAASERGLSAVHADLEKTEMVLRQVLREYMQLQRAHDKLRNEVAYWEGSVTAQGEQFVEFHQQRQELRLVNRRFQALRRLHVDLLVKLHPGLSVATVETIIEEQLEPAAVLGSRPDWEFTRSALAAEEVAPDQADDAGPRPAAAAQ